MRRNNVTLPLLGAAVLTAGAFLVQLTRKPEPRPVTRAPEKVATADTRAFLERLRERGL